MRTTALIFVILATVVAPAAAQNVDACKVFTAEMGQAIIGKPVTQSKNLQARTNGGCEFKDASGYQSILFSLWRFSTVEDSVKYFQAEITMNGGMRGAKPEPVPNLGDEAFYLSTTFSIYVRKGATWTSFGFPDRKAQLIELARKVVPKL